jgi:hypothetical protein
MPQWRDLPREIRLQIVREFCLSISFDFVRYQSKFKTDMPYQIVWNECYPRPLVQYLNALLTCREFYDIITKDIKLFNGQSTAFTLQTIQYKKLIKYSDKLFDSGTADYREITLAQAMFGCFWKNRFICDVYPIFDDMFGGLDKTGRLVLVCLSGGVLEKCKSDYSFSRGEYIRVQKKNDDGSFCGLVFSKGSYYMDGDCMTFQTVLSYEFAKFRDHDRKEVHRFYDTDDSNDIEISQNVDQSGRELPDLSAADPDTWWLGLAIGGSDHWKEWYLVNYKEEKIVVGPRGRVAEWPYDFDLESLHLWQPVFLESSYDDDYESS